MVVKKKKVQASDLLEGNELRTVNGEQVDASLPSIDGKQCAIQHIQDAIKCLAPLAKDDEIAKQSIANLAVIVFDLK